ncbi:MAG: Stk1 family PASTA domain-containing Ser/Thr kinase, partial [Propionibacteriaceae bacterium]|nr:Stk1 family PASTA domain-containing Ser/Thr kinase [Propionibacteriaceae bacterium]
MDRGDDPLVGRVLDGRYEIVERRASGGMATVYRARDRRLDREVAVKIMHEGRDDDAMTAQTFDREARAAAKLHDPHIVSVFDQGEDRGRPFIVMEYVDGCTLRTIIAHEAPMTPARAMAFMEPVAEALAVAHEAGLIHRDVKPENVLISSKGEVKVGDFGLAREVTNDNANATAVIVGTASYLPPERYLHKVADRRSDVYSAGVMLYELLTGVKPYWSDNADGIAAQHAHRDMQPPSSVIGSTAIPHWLDELVVACTRRNPELRPADGAELARRVRIARTALDVGTWNDADLTQCMNPFAESTATGIQTTAATAAPRHGAPAATPEHTPRMGLGIDEPPDDPPRPHGSRANRGPTVLPGVVRTRKYRRRRAIVLLILLVILGSIIGTSAWWLVSGRYTDVPDLARLTQADAVAAASNAQLTVTFQPAYSETVPANQIISTDPGVGARVHRDTQVTAYVSRGPQRFAMPTVIGLAQDKAQQALIDAHLAVGQVTQAYSETVASGMVISASQDPGAQLKANTAIDLVVSQGRQPIDVTSYVGQPGDAASTALTQAGLAPKQTTAYSTDSGSPCAKGSDGQPVPSGVVCAQNPASGTLFKG